MPEIETPDISPLELVKADFAALEKATGAALQEIAELDALDLRIRYNTGIEVVSPTPDQSYFRVRQDTAERLAILATDDPRSFEVTRVICAANVYHGKPLPEPLRRVATQLISGTFEIPKQSGPKPGKRFGLIFLAFGMAHLLRDAYGMPLIRGDGMSELSAADVLREAFGEFGIDCSYTSIRDWLTHKKHRTNRGQAEILWAMVKDGFLMDEGAITHRTDWVILPD